ncbi:heavy metal-responsive transcriptional regulator [Arthrobacter sp. ISL-30]|uniref:heavy metal-responsive transcriptional regulator n=1 Tax=Arthrobacter sp. ISL-30 TaxID=2819109 RepID=UPI001BE7D2AF|nr:heavy metal-responsive transcriptional regulator [Arthrobacter sp. ISL-30]MBT2515663.1 heavy metal-responsive transcriptional regulator [Arthrobacter sp. ISL-30]
MRIGEAAAAVGMTVKALRFYEERGLLPAVRRTRSGYREYSAETVNRLEFIQRSKNAGFSLAQTQEILRIRDTGNSPCSHVRDELGVQLAHLDQQIAELTALRTAVAEHYQAIATVEPADCDPGRICSYL